MISIHKINILLLFMFVFLSLSIYGEEKIDTHSSVPLHTSNSDGDVISILGTWHYAADKERQIACDIANRAAIAHCKAIFRCYDPCVPSQCEKLPDGRFECGAHVHHHAGSCSRRGVPCP